MCIKTPQDMPKIDEAVRVLVNSGSWMLYIINPLAEIVKANNKIKYLLQTRKKDIFLDDQGDIIDFNEGGKEPDSTLVLEPVHFSDLPPTAKLMRLG